MTDSWAPVSPASRVRLALRIFRAYLVVQVGLRLRRRPLPELVHNLAAGASVARDVHPPRRVSWATYRLLKLGPYRPRCLIGSLVVFRVLHEQRSPALLAIGLPEAGEDITAHAWIEVENRDVGPPPGRGDHEVMVRFR